jgi:hypothetical protein
MLERPRWGSSSLHWAVITLHGALLTRAAQPDAWTVGRRMVWTPMNSSNWQAMHQHATLDFLTRTAQATALDNAPAYLDVASLPGLIRAQPQIMHACLAQPPDGSGTALDFNADCATLASYGATQGWHWTVQTHTGRTPGLPREDYIH